MFLRTEAGISALKRFERSIHRAEGGLAALPNITILFAAHHVLKNAGEFGLVAAGVHQQVDCLRANGGALIGKENLRQRAADFDFSGVRLQRFQRLKANTFVGIRFQRANERRANLFALATGLEVFNRVDSESGVVGISRGGEKHFTNKMIVDATGEFLLFHFVVDYANAAIGGGLDKTYVSRGWRGRRRERDEARSGETDGDKCQSHGRFGGPVPIRRGTEPLPPRGSRAGSGGDYGDLFAKILAAGGEKIERWLDGGFIGGIVQRGQGGALPPADRAGGKMRVDILFLVKGQFAVGVKDQKIADFVTGHVRPHLVSGVVAEGGAHFLSGAEETVFRRFFSGTEGIANGAETEALVVAHFEDHAFAGCEIGDRTVDTGAEFAGQEAALRIVIGPLLLDCFEKVVFAVPGFGDGRFFFAYSALAEVV